MYYLSELHGRLGQILAQYGDMPVVRQQEKGIDILSTDAKDGFINYENTGILVVGLSDGSKRLCIDIPIKK